MAATILYAASDGVWKNYPCSVPPGTNYKAIYRAVETLIEYRPQFQFTIIWLQSSN
jgi:hypothetical protein